MLFCFCYERVWLCNGYFILIICKHGTARHATSILKQRKAVPWTVGATSTPSGTHVPTSCLLQDIDVLLGTIMQSADS
jgi:hypothetical protein